MTTCTVCRGTGMVSIKDPDDTYPCGCDLGDPYRTRGEMATKLLFAALPTMRKEISPQEYLRMSAWAFEGDDDTQRRGTK